MQQARMVGVSDVLDIELPIVRQKLVVVAEKDQRLLHHAANALGDKRPEISVKRRRRRRERAEHDPGKAFNAQRADIVMGGIELRGHAAFAADAAAERDPGQPAFEIVGPVVVDAADFAPAPGAVEAKQRAAMGTAILEGAKTAVAVARNNDGDVADEGPAVIAGI